MAINWIDKGARGRINTNDVRIKICKTGGKFKTCITFSNRWGETISKSGCVLVGIDGSKIYFKDSENGYRLDNNGDSARIYVRSDELLEVAKSRGGDYSISKDKVNNLWFVETNVDSGFNKYR